MHCRETWVQSLGREDPLEKEMATHSSILAWKIPWKEKPDRLHSPWGRKESDMTERLHFDFFNIQEARQFIFTRTATLFIMILLYVDF